MTASNTSGLWAGRKVGADKDGDSCGFGAGLNCRYVIEYSIAYTLARVAGRECRLHLIALAHCFSAAELKARVPWFIENYGKRVRFQIFIRSRGVIPAAM